MSHLDIAHAQRLYDGFKRHYWIERGYLAGFAEWPHGESSVADVDSGPIVLGMGLAATGWGIGAALCMRDDWRLARLLGELSMARTIFSMFGALVRRHYPFDARYITGSLMGDASIFSVVGWTPWVRADFPCDASVRGMAGETLN